MAATHELIARLILYTVVSGLQAVVVGVMTLRRLYRQWPAFYAYCAVEVMRQVILYWVMYLVQTRQLRYGVYFYAYWWTQPLMLGLCFVVVYRVYLHVMERYPALRKAGQVAFGAGAVALLIAAVVSAAAAPGSEQSRIVAAVLVLERSVEIVRCGLLLIVFAGSSYLRLFWRTHALGIALGLGTWSATDLLALALRTHFGNAATIPMYWITALGSTAAVLIWFANFTWQPALVEPPVTELPQDDLAKWNRAVSELL